MGDTVEPADPAFSDSEIYGREDSYLGGHFHCACRCEELCGDFGVEVFVGYG